MLTWKRLSLTYRLREDMPLPHFLGALLRGGFGTVFKREICIREDKDCNKCILRSKCPYLYVFETPIPKDTKIMRKYTSAPHPFVIEPPSFEEKTLPKNGTFSFGLVLIGEAIDYLPYFIYTFIRLGTKGFGRSRVKAQLISVKDGEREIYDPKSKRLRDIKSTASLELKPDFEAIGTYKVRLSFPTLLNIRKNGVVVRDLDFDIFMRSLFRRLVLLEYFHDGGSGEYPFKRLLNWTKEVKILQKELFYERITRFSTRQRQRIPIEGIRGEIVFSQIKASFIPYIKAAQDLHVGRNTSFGLGKVLVKYENEG